MRTNRTRARRTWILGALALFVPACELVVNPDPTLVPGYGGADGSASTSGDASADAADAQPSDAPFDATAADDGSAADVSIDAAGG